MLLGKYINNHMNELPKPIDVFDYVYGVLHDPVYAEMYGQYLCRDFPKVPIVNDGDLKDDDAFFVSEDMFREYVSFGVKLRSTHLMDVKDPANLILDPNSSEDMDIDAVKYKNGRLHLNARKEIIGIPEEVWDYQIGGYPVLDRWFKEHKGETLDIEKFTHIENIVGAIQKTIEIQDSLRSLHE